jgi:hypothetical protein
MQSDERLKRAFELLREPIDQYRAAIAGTCAQLTDYLVINRGETDSCAHVAASALGQFAGGRVDATRFAAAFEGVRTLTTTDASNIERCIETLDSLTKAGDTLFTCNVPAGARMDASIDDAFANLGRAFGAALAFQAIRTQVFRETTHLPLLESFPFDRWNRPERLVAPPLIVTVDGADLDAGCIARFVDGRTRLVLIVRNAAPPAVLASLITPGVYVAQTNDAADIGKIVDARGPAVVAIVDESAARFVHDPAGGQRLLDRLSVQSMPAEPPLRAIGTCTTSQQREQLAQLEVLLAASRAESQVAAADAIKVTTAVAASVTEGRSSNDAIDTLTGWLLTQAGMEQAK